ncbi:MAG: hypothetical protein H8D22_12085, partial [Candidatus Cloacimonetes bacterium]|nr:hypothetical protein [Candidatus Cloacimonadota bacterium]
MRKISITAIITLLLTNMLFGKYVEIIGNSGKRLFECTKSDRNSTELQFSLSGYEKETIVQEGEEYQRISCANEGWFTEVGKPELPRISRLIAIPDEGSISIEVLGYEDEILTEMNIYPGQSLQSKDKPESQFAKDDEFYLSDEFFPSKIAEIGTPGIMRDFRVVSITVNPFQYNPGTKELRIIKDIELDIRYERDGNAENIKTRHSKISRSFESLYRSAIINYDYISGRDDYQHGSYLFIYPDNYYVETYLQALIDWKHQKGFDVVSASTSETGSSNTSIKNYIQNAYDNWENPPEFICLVGDASGSFTIPTWFEYWSWYNGEGDHPYTQLEGNDILSDAFIGRLSFGSVSELQTIVNKILHYEKEPYMEDTDWYKSVLLVGDTSPSGQSCIITNKYIKELMLATNDYSFTELYGSQPSVSQMVNAVNNGVSFFNYRGWIGMSGWSNSTTYSLNNGFMLPVVVTLTCGTGNFHGTTGTTEAFLRAGSPTTPKGAIAAIGTATSGTHTRFNNPVSSGIYYGIFVEETYNMGGALAHGKLNLYNCFPDDPEHVAIYSYWNNLMGDPGMEVWTDIPAEMIVTYPSTIPFGSNYIEVSVEDALGVPISGVWVTALKGDDEIFSTGFTDEDGIVIIPFEAVNTGDVTLTATKHNFIPHLGNFEIIQQDYSVNYNNVDIDDDNFGTSSGNDDGNLNPGENIELIVSLKNFGIQTAPSVNAEISTENEWITVNDNYEEYGNISSGDIALPTDDFDIAIEPSCLGGTEVEFNLLIQDAISNEWTGKFYLTVEGPYLHAKSYSVVDGGNGILDPGETAELKVTVENIGSVAADGVNGTLMCSDNRLTIEDSLGYFGNISAGGQATNNSNRFELTANTQIIPGSQIVVDLHLYNADGYNDTVSFMLEVGEVTVTDPLGPDEYGYYCYDDGDTDYYNVPVYQWIEIDPSYGGSGTLIPLNDNGANQEDIEILSLPFVFRFYGEDYNEITVCSNGWIAMGQTEQATFRNWPIPGPMGPSPMIAPFWDDLYMGGGNAYYYYDIGAHYFVIEWSRVKNKYDGSFETFEVILYDPNYYPTSLNDGEIKIQYHTVNNVDQSGGSPNYTGGHYATVGIEKADATIGLGYTYNNDYPTAAKVLEDEMALLFTGPPIPFEEPYIILGGIGINDENGNGLVDYAEDVNLDIALNNIGENPATGVYALLSSPDTYITITSNSSNYDNIPGGGSGVNLTDFSFSVAENCPDGHIVSFQFEVVSNEDNWNLYFGLVVNAPDIEFSSVFVNDGDNNILDPGETADIFVSFENNGGADAYSAVVSISTEDGYLTINSDSFDFGSFPAGQTETAVFNVTADMYTPVGHSAVINWDIVAEYDYTNSGEFVIFIALSIEDFETGNFSNYDWIQGGNANWIVVTENPYEGSYCAKSGTISHNQNSELSINFDIASVSDISFYRRVSSEGNWDYLRFYIDGVQQGAWSGTVGWGEISYSVNVGNHTFTWKYTKDGSVSTGSDCAWIDYIIFPSIGFPGPPIAHFTPEEFNFYLLAGQTESDILSISNLGESNLIFLIEKDYQYERDSGGPDAYGYVWEDSDETGGPAYNWIDISEVGTLVTFNH